MTIFLLVGTYNISALKPLEIRAMKVGRFLCNVTIKIPT